MQKKIVLGFVMAALLVIGGCATTQAPVVDETTKGGDKTTETKAEAGKAIERIQKAGVLTWCSDAEGGAPYIFPDPKDPSKFIGFEVELADAFAKELGVKAKQVQNMWDSLVPSLERGDCDIAMNGIEITDERKDVVSFTKPYYVYVEQLVVQKDEKEITDMEVLKKLTGKKIGTLSGTVAQDILENDYKNVEAVIYPTQYTPYEDLALDRLDGVLLDLPIAAYYGKGNPKLKYAGEPMGEGLYGIAVRKDDTDLLDKLNATIDKMYSNGDLKKIYEKWDLWNDAQKKIAE